MLPLFVYGTVALAFPLLLGAVLYHSRAARRGNPTLHRLWARALFFTTLPLAVLIPTVIMPLLGKYGAGPAYRAPLQFHAVHGATILAFLIALAMAITMPGTGEKKARHRKLGWACIGLGTLVAIEGIVLYIVEYTSLF